MKLFIGLLTISCWAQQTGTGNIGVVIASNSSGGSGTVTSVGLAGTANQITVTGSTPITASGSWTLSLPSAVTFPGSATVTDTFTVETTNPITLGTSGFAEIDLVGKAGTGTTLFSASYGDNSNFIQYQTSGGTFASPSATADNTVIAVRQYQVNTGSSTATAVQESLQLSGSVTGGASTAPGIWTITVGTGGSGNTGMSFDGPTQVFDIGGTLVLDNGTTNALKIFKSFDSPTSPGHNYCSFDILPGTNSGTGKLVMYCGTSATGITIVDNVGSGF